MSNIFSSYFDDDKDKEKQGQSPSQVAAEQQKTQQEEQKTNLFASYFDDAEKRGIQTPNPNPPTQQEPEKESLGTRVKNFLSNVFKKKDEQPQDPRLEPSTGGNFFTNWQMDISNKHLAKALEDRYIRKREEEAKDAPDQAKLDKYLGEIGEIEDALSYPSGAEGAFTKKYKISNKYEIADDFRAMKGDVAGLAKNIFDGVAQLFEVDFAKQQQFADTQEENIRKAIELAKADGVTVSKEDEERLFKEYSPRNQPSTTLGAVIKPANAPTLAEREKRMEVARETGEKGFQDVLKVYVEDNARRSPDIMDQISSGVTSMAAFYVATVLTGGGSVVAGTLEALGESGSVYSTNRDNGLDPIAAFEGSRKDFIANIIWNVTLDKFSGIFDGMDDVAKQGIKQKVLATIKASSAEGIQEAGQQIISNITTYADDVWEGVLESFGIGAIVGGGAAGVQTVGGSAVDTNVDTTQEVTGEPTAGAAPQQVEENQKDDEEFNKQLDDYLKDRTVKFRRDPSTIVRDDIGRFAKTDTKEYRYTYNLNNKDDAEYVARVFSESLVDDFKNGEYGRYKSLDRVQEILNAKLVQEDVADTTVQDAKKLVDDNITTTYKDGLTVYHGGSSKFIDQLESGQGFVPDAEREAGTGGNRFGLSTSKNYEMAKNFSTSSTDKGSVAEISISKDAKVLEIKNEAEFLDDISEEVTKELAKKYDIIVDKNNTMGENEVRILNPAVIESVNGKKLAISPILEAANEYSKEIPVTQLNLNSEDFKTAQGDVLEGTNKAFSQLPALVEKNANGTYDIIDGNHRVAEALLRGDENIKVIENEALYRELASVEEGATKFRVKDDVKTITGKTITDAQEQQLIDLNKEIFGDEDVKITLQILANREALGSYRDNLIKIVDGQVDPKDTFYHEAVHKYLDVFTTKQEQAELFREGITKYGTTDLAQVEENIAEDFISYAKSREGVLGKIKGVFDKVLNRVNAFIGNENKINALYDEILKPAEAKKTADQKEAVKKEAPKEPKTPKSPPPAPPAKTTQEPVGQGKPNVSRLAERVAEQLDGEQADLPTYNRVNLEDQATKAATFIEENPEQAVAVALGMIDPPAGQLRNPIALGTALKAREEGNFALYTEIMNSNSLQNTRLGQEIVSLRGNFNDNSPENYVKRIISNRYEQLGRKLITNAERAGKLLGKTPNYKAAVTTKIDEETAKLKEKVKKDQVKLRLAQDIIDAMRC